MARFCVCPRTGLKRGAWSPEEDRILSAFIARHGHLNWRLLLKQAGLARDGKSCRLRWMNYLRPDLKRGNFSKEEDEIIVRMHERLGNRWSAIVYCLPGRTDNEIKNHWHTRLEKIAVRNVALEHSIESGNIASPPVCLGNNSSLPQNSVLVTKLATEIWLFDHGVELQHISH